MLLLLLSDDAEKENLCFFSLFIVLLAKESTKKHEEEAMSYGKFMYVMEGGGWLVKKVVVKVEEATEWWKLWLHNIFHAQLGRNNTFSFSQQQEALR